MVPEGILPVDKPPGITSRRVTRRVMEVLGCKAGHCGTLDPIATGVLLVCTGRATLVSKFLSGLEKRYRVLALIGRSTDTFDIQGRVTRESDASHVTKKDIMEVLKEFSGEITQTVPAFSAVKIKGRPLYSYARKGQKIEPPSRKVQIRSIELLSIKENGSKMFLELEISCGKGTYVRSIIHDLGTRLGCGACVAGLRRVSQGPIEECMLIPYDEIHPSKRNFVESRMLSLEETTEFFPTIRVSRDGEECVRLGKPLRREWCTDFPEDTSFPARVMSEEGVLLAIYGEPRETDCEEIAGRAIRVIRPIEKSSVIM